MKKLVFGVLAALGLALGVGAGPARAGALWYRGVVYHPYYGNVAYLYAPATGYVYFPALGRGGYLPRGGGVARPAWATPPRSRVLSPRDFGGSVIGGPGGVSGFISSDRGPSVTFGPGGPIYSSRD